MMSESVHSTPERDGPAFSVDGMLQARAATPDAIHTISALVKPDMLERLPYVDIDMRLRITAYFVTPLSAARAR